MITASIKLNAPIYQVWESISDRTKTKEWYFNFSDDFILEQGRKFDWYGGPADGKQWLHRGEMLKIIPNDLLSHSWEYPGYSGTSIVTWKLTPVENNLTLLNFKHEFIIPFDEKIPELHIDNFKAGWNEILTINLPEYLLK